MGFKCRYLSGLAVVVALSALCLTLSGGCAKKLEGNTEENQKPLVWFVNVPPEGSQSSVNPIINWLGTDRDGQIDYYRYIVVREDLIGQMLGKPADWSPLVEPLTPTEVQTFAADGLFDLSDTLWTRLYVRADEDDPHTSNIIPMSAQVDDPVRVYVPQFVFVQAFDIEGLGSDIVFRRFMRNDNPPESRIVGFVANVPFINSVIPTGPATGSRFRWRGTDVLDYPTDPPPFEFEWTIFGPYSLDLYNQLVDSFVVPVFVTTDAQIFPQDNIPECDTFWTGQTIDSIVCHPTMLIVCDTTYPRGVETIDCDTILIDTLAANNVYGRLDTLIRVYDEDFTGSALFNRVATESDDGFGNRWVTDTRDSMYNLYWNAPADTTQQDWFLFVVRARDDAQVPDLTPAFVGFEVINPKHERDVLVFNWTNSANQNRGLIDTARTYWENTINTWAVQTGRTIDYNPATDYRRGGSPSDVEYYLRRLLSYKIAIMYQDACVSGGWAAQEAKRLETMTALQTGTFVWVTARVPQGNHLFGSPPRAVEPSPAYTEFFGVDQTTFSGWGYFIIFQGGLRVEDLTGALSLRPDLWPDVTIDTALLHRRYRWDVPWRPDLGALPEVGWGIRTFDTEVMYLYKSMYGPEHALFSELSFHGKPVGHRLNRGLYRTVHWMFTPMGLDSLTGQVAVNNVMSWLWDGRIAAGGGVAANDGRVPREHSALSEDYSERYWRCYWQAEGDAETFYQLLDNAY